MLINTLANNVTTPRFGQSADAQKSPGQKSRPWLMPLFVAGLSLLNVAPALSSSVGPDAFESCTKSESNECFKMTGRITADSLAAKREYLLNLDRLEIKNGAMVETDLAVGGVVHVEDYANTKSIKAQKIHLYGVVRGNAEADEEIHLYGRVTGNATASWMLLYDTVEGNVVADEVILQSDDSVSVHGSITTNKIEIHGDRQTGYVLKGITLKGPNALVKRKGDYDGPFHFEEPGGTIVVESPGHSFGMQTMAKPQDISKITGHMPRIISSNQWDAEQKLKEEAQKKS